MPKYFLFMLIALSISFGPAKALFSKCDDDDYQRPTLHEFYSNTDIKKEKGLLKKPSGTLRGFRGASEEASEAK